MASAIRATPRPEAGRGRRPKGARAAVWLFGPLLAGCGPAPALPACNGLVALCDRPLDATAFLKTHNSHASEARGYSPLATNQFEAIPEQLADGVRSLNVDVYLWEGEVHACHGLCELGHQPLVEILDEIATFLEEHPRQIALLDFQDETPPGTLGPVLAGHRIAGLAHTQPAGAPWPTLGELDEAGTPLVIFGDPVEGDPPWFHPMSAFTYRTGWSYQTPEELDCAPADPVVPGGLYEIVHVLTNPLASPENAEAINHQPVIGERIDRCLEEVGFVNQVSVDFYRIGDGLAAVEDLNRAGPADRGRRRRAPLSASPPPAAPSGR